MFLRHGGVSFAWQAWDLVSAALLVAFAWQAWDLVHCKGSDVRPGVPWSPPLCWWLLRGRRGTWCTARGRMYALASLGLRRSAGGFCMACAPLGALQGVGCTPWRPLVSTHDTHNMNTAHIHHHNITYQNITWHVIISRHMQQDQYIYVCIHLHYYNPTSHHTKIVSHTHTHTYNIRMYITYITNCLLHPVHISLTHYQSDTPVHAHRYIHTNSSITPPSPSYSSSLVAFLCSV